MAADEDTVREVIHRFNKIGLDCLDPNWAGGRPRLLSPGDEDLVAATATARPNQAGLPNTDWSVRKLTEYLGKRAQNPTRIGRETVRALLHRHRITFQHTSTWKDSTDPDLEAKLNRIEEVQTNWPERTFAFV